MTKARGADKTLRGVSSERPISEPPVSIDPDTTTRIEIASEPLERADRELKEAVAAAIRTCKAMQARQMAQAVVVLLVEDDENLQRAWKRVFLSAFSRVDTARSYKEALLRLARNVYDIVVCDHRLLGEGSGADVIRWMRDQNGVHGSTPAILISGVLDDEDTTGAATQACGASRYLQKGSFTNAELLELMRDLLALE
jgi:CheY-like chemotaxis protein